MEIHANFSATWRGGNVAIAWRISQLPTCAHARMQPDVRSTPPRRFGTLNALKREPHIRFPCAA